MDHQSDTALSGMWLFLATELVFFCGLFLLYMIYRHFHPIGFANASLKSRLLIGTINTVILLTSSAVFFYGFNRVRLGDSRRGGISHYESRDKPTRDTRIDDNRALFRACAITLGLGILFLALKGYEWKLDLDDNLFPGPRFSITGEDSGAAQLFWCFYFIGTGLHGIHMIVGIGLVGWIAWAARQVRFSARYYTPVEIVGLYWSFVDMVWLTLYPLIYLVHRGSP